MKNLSKQKYFSKTSLAIILILVASISGAIFFLVNPRTNAAQKDRPKFKQAIVKRKTFKIVVTANGVVKPIDRIEIKSKASGEIKKLPVEEGDFIQQGQLIAKLDQHDELAEVAQAKANSDIAIAELRQAKQQFKRRNKLFQNNLISEENREQIELSLVIAKGKLIRANTVLSRARERLSESIVRAPISGIILQKYVEKGQIIASGINSVSGGTPIIDLADMTSVFIEAGIDEIDIGKIEVGNFAIVIAEAYPQLKFKGEVIRIAPEAKIEQNVTLFNVIIEVKNTEYKLKSGMNATIELMVQRKENVLLAPATAFLRPLQDEVEPNLRRVLLKQGNRFVARQVIIGLSNFTETEIISGVEEGSILGIEMKSRLKAENERLSNRIKRSRSFGSKKRKN